MRSVSNQVLQDAHSTSYGGIPNAILKSEKSCDEYEVRLDENLGSSDRANPRSYF